MKKFNLTLIAILVSFFLVSCTDTSSNEETNTKTESAFIESNFINPDFKNVIISNYKLADVTQIEVNNFNLRNAELSSKYKKDLSTAIKFSNSNSLNLTFQYSIDDYKNDLLNNKTDSALLNSLSSVKSNHYYTESDSLNVDIEIPLTSHENISSLFKNISYKASIQQIDETFNFKDSKLNEFRNSFIKETIDYNVINEYVRNYFNNTLPSDSFIFFNKIDKNYFESFRIENNVAYYKLIYSPKI